MLELLGLSKSFENTVVVDDISFSVAPGTVFGLVGPNGAGKTTTMRMILDIIRPDSGEILLDQVSRPRLKRSLFGYLPEERGLYQRARVMDHLVYMGILNRLSRHRAEVEVIRLLDKFGLVDYTMRRVNELSRGMQQKIQLIAASLHDPRVIILDEPFSGLDPVNQMLLREIIGQFKEDGKIVILSSHNMPEVEKLSENICLINQGRVIIQGPLSDLKAKHTEDAFYIESDDDLTFLHEIKGIKILEEQNRSCKFSPTDKPAQNKKVIQDIISRIELKKFYRVEPSLNDIFVELVQKENVESTS